MALVSDRYDAVVHFYGDTLGFARLDSWDRPNGRGQRFDLGGLRLEVIDHKRERTPLRLESPADRVHIVVEVDDVAATRGRLGIETPAPTETTWGARLFQIRDPDGVAVTFLQWDTARKQNK